MNVGGYGRGRIGLRLIEYSGEGSVDEEESSGCEDEVSLFSVDQRNVL